MVQTKTRCVWEKVTQSREVGVRFPMAFTPSPSHTLGKAKDITLLALRGGLMKSQKVPTSSNW